RGHAGCRMTAERGPRDDVVLPHRPIIPEYRPEGHQAASERLADRDEIRRDVEMLDPPHLPGAAEAGLHLVGDEEPTVLVREFAKSAHEILRGNPDARL